MGGNLTIKGVYKMKNKIKKIDIYQYPENLGNRLDSGIDENGNLFTGTPPLEYALLEKVNEIIDHINHKEKYIDRSERPVLVIREEVKEVEI
jgi:hypothetical protein